MTETALGLVAASWGVVMALSPTLQIRRILRRRSSADVSVGYLSILVVGFFLWVLYGASLRNAVLIVPNALAFMIGVATIFVALRFRASTA